MILNNEEMGKQIFMFFFNNIKQGLQALANEFKKYSQEKSHEKNALKLEEKKLELRESFQDNYVHGKQNVKELMKQNQQLNSIDISTDSSLRSFNKIAKNHGVDFAIKQNPATKQYVAFFKAKDADVIASVFAEFSSKELNKKTKKESLIGKINDREKAAKKMQNEKQNQSDISEKSMSGKEVKNAEAREL